MKPDQHDEQNQKQQKPGWTIGGIIVVAAFAGLIILPIFLGITTGITMGFTSGVLCFLLVGIPVFIILLPVIKLFFIKK